MIEIIKHSIGLCGEAHPNLLLMSTTIASAIYFLKHNIRYCWKKGCNMCSTKIKQIIKK